MFTETQQLVSVANKNLLYIKVYTSNNALLSIWIDAYRSNVVLEWPKLVAANSIEALKRKNNKFA